MVDLKVSASEAGLGSPSGPKQVCLVPMVKRNKNPLSYRPGFRH